MSHNSLISEIETWLIGKALGDPEIVGLFEALCQRLHGVGVPVERAVLSWPTLHPLFRAEQIFWWLGKGAKLEQYYHSSAGSELWKKSPFHRVQTRNLPRLRRRLSGENAFLDFGRTSVSPNSRNLKVGQPGLWRVGRQPGRAASPIWTWMR
jgi:adenylate cyclase